VYPARNRIRNIGSIMHRRANAECRPRIRMHVPPCGGSPPSPGFCVCAWVIAVQNTKYAQAERNVQISVSATCRINQVHRVTPHICIPIHPIADGVLLDEAADLRPVEARPRESLPQAQHCKHHAHEGPAHSYRHHGCDPPVARRSRSRNVARAILGIEGDLCVVQPLIPASPALTEHDVMESVAQKRGRENREQDYAGCVGRGREPHTDLEEPALLRGDIRDEGGPEPDSEDRNAPRVHCHYDSPCSQSQPVLSRRERHAPGHVPDKTRSSDGDVLSPAHVTVARSG